MAHFVSHVWRAHVCLPLDSGDQTASSGHSRNRPWYSISLGIWRELPVLGVPKVPWVGFVPTPGQSRNCSYAPRFSASTSYYGQSLSCVVLFATIPSPRLLVVCVIVCACKHQSRLVSLSLPPCSTPGQKPLRTGYWYESALCFRKRWDLINATPTSSDERNLGESCNDDCEIGRLNLPSTDHRYRVHFLWHLAHQDRRSRLLAMTILPLAILKTSQLII